MQRHVNDSLRAVGCLQPADELLIDIGAGAGLPGIPVAITEPRRRVVLIEPIGKRAAFLEFAVEELGLTNTSVEVARGEALRLSGDVCFARALASPPKAWRLAERLLRPGGRLIYFAGRSWAASVAADLERIGVEAHACAPPDFAWQGPIVMMARTSQ